MGLLDPKVFDNPWFQLGSSILANNAGHYGAFGPALGGGLTDFNRMRALAQENARRNEEFKVRQQEMEMKRKQMERYNAALGSLTPEQQNQFALGAKWGDVFPEAKGNEGVYGTVHYDKEGNAWVIDKYGNPKKINVPLQRPMVTANAGLNIYGLDPITGEKRTSVQYKPKPTETPEWQSNVERGKALGKNEAAKEINEPKEAAKLREQELQYETLTQMIDRAERDAGVSTVGFIGGTTKGIPGSPAHDLQNTLNTIKSNLGFDKLQSMRDASPTGGALGQVSEMENRLLQSVWGSLEQSQSDRQFKENLQIVRATLDAVINGRRDDFKAKYGRRLKSRGIDVDAAFSGGAQATPLPAKPSKMTLKKGVVYDTPRGQLRWNGQAFEDL